MPQTVARYWIGNRKGARSASGSSDHARRMRLTSTMLIDPLRKRSRPSGRLSLSRLVNEALADARTRHRSELRERERDVQLSVAKLEAAVAGLETALAIERSQVLDLPSFLLKAVNLANATQ
jgi:hypothetical protein